MRRVRRQPPVRPLLAVLAAIVLVIGLNGCGGPGNVVSCPQRAWSKGRIERSNGLSFMDVRQSFNWTSMGLNGTCVGYGTQWVGVNWSGTYTYCQWNYVFPYYADCNGDPQSAENRTQNDYKSSDVWGNFDWNVWSGSSGRVNIHTYVQGYKSGNAHTHCWKRVLEGPDDPWGTELRCTGGNS